MKLRYTLLLEHDPEEGVYSVSVPLLPGCLTYGDTVEEAMERAQEAIEGFLLVLQDQGEEIPEEDGSFQLVTVDVEFPPDSEREGGSHARRSRR
jgi:predicted RNase H-like HicB family nuclease